MRDWLDRLAESTATWYIMTNNCTTHTLNCILPTAVNTVFRLENANASLSLSHMYFACRPNIHICIIPNLIFSLSPFIILMLFRFLSFFWHPIVASCKFNLIILINNELFRFYTVLPNLEILDCGIL